MIATRAQRSSATPAGAGDSVGTAVLGAGPAGLTAAYMLALCGRPGMVYEADRLVGGMAKTLRRGDYRFDLGGQVFSTTRAPIQELWDGLLGADLVRRPRRARLHRSGAYTAYPPKARCLVATLGLTGSETQAQAIIQQIERYCDEQWPRERRQCRHQWGTTLIEDYSYPRLGPGQMWERLRDVISRSGIPVRVDHRCVALHHSRGRIDSVVVRSGGNHVESRVEGVLSSIPLSELTGCLRPAPPADVLRAAAELRFRSMRFVALMADAPEAFPEAWIHVHGAGARARRIQNFGVWSRDMVPSGASCVGIEFACAPGDELWQTDNARALELASEELGRMGLIDPDRVVDGTSLRVERAYPIRDGAALEALDVVRSYLQTFENLQTFGRNGLHQDDTQDHSMWSAMRATRNLVGGSSHDVWTFDAGVEGAARSSPAEALPSVGGAVAGSVA